MFQSIEKEEIWLTNYSHVRAPACCYLLGFLVAGSLTRILTARSSHRLCQAIEVQAGHQPDLNHLDVGVVDVRFILSLRGVVKAGMGRVSDHTRANRTCRPSLFPCLADPHGLGLVPCHSRANRTRPKEGRGDRTGLGAEQAGADLGLGGDGVRAEIGLDWEGSWAQKIKRGSRDFWKWGLNWTTLIESYSNLKRNWVFIQIKRCNKQN